LENVSLRFYFLSQFRPPKRKGRFFKVNLSIKYFLCSACWIYRWSLPVEKYTFTITITYTPLFEIKDPWNDLIKTVQKGLRIYSSTMRTASYPTVYRCRFYNNAVSRRQALRIFSLRFIVFLLKNSKTRTVILKIPFIKTNSGRVFSRKLHKNKGFNVKITNNGRDIVWALTKSRKLGPLNDRSIGFSRKNDRVRYGHGQQINSESLL